MKRACVFVDGENFRHSLKHLFQTGRYSFGKADYLPETDWHAFFASLANRFECELLRVYWYVVEHIDCRPKFVYCVSFLDKKGKQLPGGARRLSNAVDSRADLHFELVRKAMRIEEVLTEMPIAV